MTSSSETKPSKCHEKAGHGSKLQRYTPPPSQEIDCIVGVALGGALTGYILAKSGRRFACSLVVNDVGVISGIDDVLPVFQDQGTIAGILWKLL